MPRGSSHESSRTRTRTSRRRRSRRGIPVLEALESRGLLSLTVQFANAVGVLGTGSVDVESNAVTNDAAGNVYITGSLVGTADFDPGASTANLTSTGGRDVVIARYSKDGALVWAKGLGGVGTSTIAQGSAIAVDGSGNVFVSGTFTGTVNFDPAGTAPGATFTAPGRNDAFLAKYDASGGFLWARACVGAPDRMAQGYALATDTAGNVAIAGSFQSSLVLGTYTLVGGGTTEGFVAKVGPSGQFLWASGTEGTGTSQVQMSGVAFDALGNVVSTGLLAGTADLRPGAGTASFTAVGGRDVVVRKLDGSGSFLWAVVIGGEDVDQGTGVATDGSGNVYVTGTYSSTVDFDPGPGTASLTAGLVFDPFLLKLSANGQFGWVRGFAMTQSGYGFGTGVDLDGSNHVYVSGYFGGKMTLDAAVQGGSLTTAGGFDVFVAEFDTNGGFKEARSFGGTNFDADFGIGVNASGQVALAGRYTGPATFGSTTLPIQPGKSIFIAQLGTPAVSHPPLPPSPPALQAASDAGLSNSDRITNLRSLTFDVADAAQGHFVELLRDGVVVASRFGPGPLTDSGPVADGPHQYTARQTDPLAQVSDPSGVTWVTVVVRTPATPGRPSLASADDTGAKGDGITSARQPRFLGSIEPQTMAQLLGAGGQVIGSALAGSDGSFTVAPSTPLADGQYVVTVREVDLAGNQSVASASFVLNIDGTAPATPAAPTLLPADDSGTTGDGLTNVRRPRLTGTVEANATVRLYAGAVWVGTTTAAANGAYTVSPDNPLSDGAYALTVQVVDAAGNASASSPSRSLAIDATAPAAPALPALLAADDSGAKGDGLTNVRQPRWSGTAEASAVLKLLSGPTLLGTTTVGPAGAYTISPSSGLADGTYTLTLQAVDAAGNSSAVSATFSVTIDSGPPAAPSRPALYAADDTGTAGDLTTSARQPRLTGTAEAGVTVQLLNGAGDVIGTTQANGAGAYTVVPASPLPEGQSVLSVKAVDAAGNVGPVSGGLVLTIDATAPAAPSSLALQSSSDTGAPGDGITSIGQPDLTGTAEAGTVVQLLTTGGTVLASATASANGGFVLRPVSRLTDGTYDLVARATDAAGNIGASGPSFRLTVDSQAPTAPSTPTLPPADDSDVKGDGSTSNHQPRLMGTAEPGSTVELRNARGDLLGSGVAESNGSYLVRVASPLADGTHVIQARARDAAGNTGPSSGPFSLTIYTPAVVPPTPSTPALLAADDTGTKGDGLTAIRQPRLTGTSVYGLSVQIIDANGDAVGSASVAANGTYTVTITTGLPDGVRPFRARAVDSQGNLSAVSGAFNLAVDGTPPAAPGRPGLRAADDSGTQGDGLTNVRKPGLTATAEPGSTVQLVDALGNVWAAGTAAGDGGVQLSAVNAQADGSYSLMLRATDAAGNVGPLGPALDLTIDTVAPAAPGYVFLLAADDTGTLYDGVTSNNRPRLFGLAPVGTTVLIVDASGRTIASGPATSDGGYTVQPSGPLADGTYRLQVQLADAAGNIGPLGPTAGLVILARPLATPAAPTVLPADDTGTPGDAVTTARRPRLTGTVEANVRVDLVGPNGDVLGTGNSGSGTYTVQPSSSLPLGPTLVRIRTTDVAGNVSTLGAGLTVTIINRPPSDFDGDGKSDIGVYRAASAQWTVKYSSGTGSFTTTFGAPNLSDIPVPGDYDGDGRAEPAYYRPSTGDWYVMSSAGTPRSLGNYGWPGLYDIPVPGDYDGDGRDEMAVYRAATGEWFALTSTGHRLLGVYGWPGMYDVPVPGDYDGDGRTDMAVYRRATGEWFAMTSTGHKLLGVFGLPNLTDVPVPGDYDGVGHAELAVFRPSTSQWFVLSPGGWRVADTYGQANLADFPLESPMGSLKKIGSAGTIKIASLTIGAPPRGSALTTAPAGTSTTAAPGAGSTRTVPTGADQTTRSRPARVARADDVVDHAISSLTSGRGGLAHWLRGRR